MKIRTFLMMVCALVMTSGVFAQRGNGKGGTALPAQTITFDGGTCTARFVRSASGIINETSRTCTFFGYEDVKIQFRPIGGTPNPECDPEGLLVPSFTFTNNEASLAPYFGTTTYNVCAYLESPASTGDFEFNNGGYTAHFTYTAGNVSSDDDLAAQGTLTYTDSRITYTIDVQYLKTVGNTTYLLGQVTSVNGENICCQLGNYIFYKLVDNGEPGAGLDQVSGADLGAITEAEARAYVESMYSPAYPNPFTITSGNIEVY